MNGNELPGELTSQDVAEWFRLLNMYTHISVGTRQVSKDHIAAYVQKLEQRVMRLANKLADQS